MLETTILTKDCFIEESHMFKAELLNNISSFCISSKPKENSDKEFFIECLKCKIKVCPPCMKMCHSNCQTEYYSYDLTQENFIVFKLVDSCKCDHNEKNSTYSKEKNNCYIFDFFPNMFIVDTFCYLFKDGLKNNQIEMNNDLTPKIYCMFCKENCYKENKKINITTPFISSPDQNQKIEEFIKNKKSKNMDDSIAFARLCDCDKIHHIYSMEFIINFIRSKFDSSEYKIENMGKIIEILIKKSEIKKSIIGSESKNNSIVVDEENSDSEIIKDSEINKNLTKNKSNHLKILLNLIMNKCFPLDHEIETNLMDYLIEQLENKDKIFFDENEINTLLTYIFHFYKKRFFLNPEIVLINVYKVSSIPNRLNIFKKNREVYNQLLKDTEKMKIFEIKKINEMLKKILNFNEFYIRVHKRVSKCNSYPFATYFLKMFIKTFCFKKNDLKKFKEFLNTNKNLIIRNNQKENIKLIKNDIDEILYLIQIQEIDLNFEIIESKNSFDNEFAKAIYNSFYFYQRDTIHKIYFDIVFSGQDYYEKKIKEIKNCSKNTDEREKKIEKILKDFIDYDLNYLNIFHFNFLKKTTIFKKIHQKIKDRLSNKLTQLKTKNIYLPIKNHNIEEENPKNLLKASSEECCISYNNKNRFSEIISFLNYRILGSFYSEHHQNYFIEIINNILSKIISDMENIKGHGNFLDNLINSMKIKYKQKAQNIKNGKTYSHTNFNNYEIDTFYEESPKKKNTFDTNFKKSLKNEEFNKDNFNKDENQKRLNTINLKNINLNSYIEDLKFLFFFFCQRIL